MLEFLKGLLIRLETDFVAAVHLLAHLVFFLLLLAYTFVQWWVASY